MSITLYVLKAVASAITDPWMAFILVILGVTLFIQNKKTTIMQKMIIGEKQNSPLELTMSQLVLGIFAGVIASLILTYFGVFFDENSSIYLLFFISIIFMMWSPRLICFAYSGAALGAVGILIQYVLKKDVFGIGPVDIAAIMTLVAVMHFVESILVAFDGSRGAIPVFTNRNNKIAGGFAYKRYWTLPIAILLIVHEKSTGGNYMSVEFPKWWPILSHTSMAAFLKTAMIGFMSLYGVLGYSSVNFTSSKRTKPVISGALIMLYSVILFVLARLANYGLVFKIIVIIFAPLGHEFLLFIQRYMEVHGKPKFISDDNGIAILDIALMSPAHEMGIKSGDKLVEINNEKIEDEKDVSKLLSNASNFLWLKIRKPDGEIKSLNYNKFNSSKRLGIIFVPKNIPKTSNVVKVNEQSFTDIIEKLKNKSNLNNFNMTNNNDNLNNKNDETNNTDSLKEQSSKPSSNEESNNEDSKSNDVEEKEKPQDKEENKTEDTENKDEK